MSDRSAKLYVIHRGFAPVAFTFILPGFHVCTIRPIIMRMLRIIRVFLPLVLVTGVSSQLLLPQFLRQRQSTSPNHLKSQNPIMDKPNIALPPTKKPDPSNDGRESVVISDVIGKERTINIFAGFTRDLEGITNRLEDSSEHTTVLAPLNSALAALPRKPWENQDDYAAMGERAYDGTEGGDRAHRNLRSFVERHVVPTSPWKEGVKVRSTAGHTIWWETKNGRKLIFPGEIEVSSIADKVGNGEVWILKGVVPP